MLRVAAIAPYNGLGPLHRTDIKVAKNPTQDYGRDLGRLEGSVDVLKTQSYTVIGFLVAIVGGGIFLLVQINNVRNELLEKIDSVRTELSQKIDKLQGAVTTLGGGQSSANETLSRIEKRLTETQQPRLLALTAEQVELLHSALKFEPDLAYKGIGQPGAFLPDTKLYDYPSGLADKIPELKDTQYTFDMKKQILIVSTVDRRIVAVV